MITNLKETLNRVLPKNVQISIEINSYNHFLILLVAINWEHLIQIIKNARECAGKQNRGPDPHYRELAGAVVVRALKSCTLREAAELIQYHALARMMCNLENSDWTPDFRTIHDFETSLKEEGLKRVNEYILNIAKENGFLQVKGLCADTTAQEASIPYPTEIGLAHQFIKSLTAGVTKMGEKFCGLKNYMEKKLEIGTKYLKQYRFFAGNVEEKKEILKKLIVEAKKVQKKVSSIIKTTEQKTISSLRGHSKKALNNTLDLLETFSDLAPQMDYFVKTGRVAKNKIISFFQKLAKSIPRGKDGKKTEFGIQWCIAQFAGGYISGFSNGRMFDGDYALKGKSFA